jgi:hypothetical protein
MRCVWRCNSPVAAYSIILIAAVSTPAHRFRKLLKDHGMTYSYGPQRRLLGMQLSKASMRGLRQNVFIVRSRRGAKRHAQQFTTGSKRRL